MKKIVKLGLVLIFVLSLISCDNLFKATLAVSYTGIDLDVENKSGDFYLALTNYTLMFPTSADAILQMTEITPSTAAQYASFTVDKFNGYSAFVFADRNYNGVFDNGEALGLLPGGLVAVTEDASFDVTFSY